MFKKLHVFTINKKETIEVEQISQNEQGETIKTLKKEDREVPYTFFLRRPNRFLNDEANLYHGIEVSRGIKAGLLTIPLLDKRNENDGGVLNEKDGLRYSVLIQENVNLENEFQQLNIKKELTEEEKKRKEELGKLITDNRKELYHLQNLKNSAYDHTAEIRARNLTLNWWLLFLSYQDVGGKEVPFFGEGDHETKLKKYDDYIDKDDEFINTIIFKFLTYTSLWYNNRSLTPEDFERFEKLIEEDTKASQDLTKT